MANKRVHIDQLSLNVSGISRDQAHWLGRQVARYLSQEMPSATVDRRIGTLHCRTHGEPGLSADALARRIAKTIVGKLR